MISKKNLLVQLVSGHAFRRHPPRRLDTKGVGVLFTLGHLGNVAPMESRLEVEAMQRAILQTQHAVVATTADLAASDSPPDVTDRSPLLNTISILPNASAQDILENFLYPRIATIPLNHQRSFMVSHQ